MNTKPKFSLLVANYNNGKFFKTCFDSIIAQTYQNWECIIVDDCSTDNSVEIIKDIISTYKGGGRFLIYHNEKNSGVGFTKRKCAEMATGDIFGYLDPDDAITPDALEIMINAHIKHPNAGLIYSNFICCDEELNPTHIAKNKQVENNNPIFFILDGGISHFSTFKKDTYLKTEGMNPYMRKAIDMDLYFKLYEKGIVLYIDKELYMYRIHRGGISTFGNVRKAYFWRWVAIIKAAERRNVNIEDLFFEHFYRKVDIAPYMSIINFLKKFRIIKILKKLKLLK